MGSCDFSADQNFSCTTLTKWQPGDKHEKDRLYFDIIDVNIDRLLYIFVFRLLRLYVNYIKQVSCQLSGEYFK